MEKLMWLFRYIKLSLNPYAEYFGVCPKCLQNDGYLNVGRVHVFVCHKHRMGWIVGENLFSSWREQDEGTFKKNEELLYTYREIESYHPGTWLWTPINWFHNLKSKIFKDESIPF